MKDCSELLNLYCVWGSSALIKCLTPFPCERRIGWSCYLMKWRTILWRIITTRLSSLCMPGILQATWKVFSDPPPLPVPSAMLCGRNYWQPYVSRHCHQVTFFFTTLIWIAGKPDILVQLCLCTWKQGFLDCASVLACDSVQWKFMVRSSGRVQSSYQ